MGHPEASAVVGDERREPARRSVHAALFRASVENALRHPVRLWATVGCLVAVGTPFLVGLAVLDGVRAEAARSVAAGGDLFVTGYEHGRNASLPESLVATSQRIPGVASARGRIVGRCYLDRTLITLVGLGAAAGRSAPAAGQVWLGAALARDLDHASAGGTLVLRDMDEVRLTVARVLPPDAGLASARLAVVALADAQNLYGTPGRISDLQVWIQPPPPELRSSRILEAAFRLRLTGIPLRIQTEKLVSDYVDRGLTLKGGTFLALYVVAFAVAIPALIVTSGFGLAVRRREIGLFKAVGFSVVDVMEMALSEVILLAALSTVLCFLAAWSWVRLLDGALIASFFVAGLEHGALVEIPARFHPGPLAIAFGGNLVLLASGLLWTSFRAATAPPVEALQ
jgi:hypothetical protein